MSVDLLFLVRKMIEAKQLAPMKANTCRVVQVVLLVNNEKDVHR